MLCEAFPVTGLESFKVYQGLGCTIIAGDLFITNLPASVNPNLLRSLFSNIKQIRGVLSIVNNPLLGSANVFTSLTDVQGIHLLNNPALFDARITSLKYIASNVTVLGCDRLCPARYPYVGPTGDQSGCTDTAVKYFLHVIGQIEPNNFPLLVSLFNRGILSKTSGVVSHVFMLKC